MEIRYFNSWAHTTQFTMEAQMMLIAELIADSLIIGGETSLAFAFDKKKDKLSSLQKVNFFHSFIQNEKLDKDFQSRMLLLLNEYYEELKFGLSNLSKNNKRFIEFKKTERLILIFFNDIACTYEESLTDSVFTELRKWKKNHPEKIVLEGLSRIGASNKRPNALKEAESILEFMFPRNSNGTATIMALQPQLLIAYLQDWGIFLHENKKSGNQGVLTFKDMEIYCEEHAGSPNSFDLWMIRLMDIPHINHLTPLELIQLKQDLQVSTALFNDCANRWIECRNKSVNEKEELVATHVELIKSSKAIQKKLREHPLCNSLDRGQNKLRIYTDIFFLAIKLESIWTYFEQYKIVHPDTVQALRTLATNNPAFPPRVPAIGICIRDDKANSEHMPNQIPTADLMVKKKSIDWEDE